MIDMRPIDKYVKVFSMDMEQMPIKPTDAYEQGFKDAIEWAANNAKLGFAHDIPFYVDKQSILKAINATIEEVEETEVERVIRYLKERFTRFQLEYPDSEYKFDEWIYEFVQY